MMNGLMPILDMSKYKFTGSDVNDDLLKIADISFNKPDQKVPITIVRKPTDAEIRKVLVIDPIRA